MAEAMKFARTKTSAHQSGDWTVKGKAVSDVINDALRAAGLMR
jgi:hypothetical protein